MKIHSALEAGGRVVKKETVTSWDRFQAQSIWEIPAKTSNRQTAESPLTPWEQLAQVQLLSNEFQFVD